jgi:hypothetical protein
MEDLYDKEKLKEAVKMALGKRGIHIITDTIAEEVCDEYERLLEEEGI